LNRPLAISPAARKRIVNTRLSLERQKYAQTGPSAIKWELAKAGHQLPSDSTIKRVLKKEGLVKKKLVTSPRVSNIRSNMSQTIYYVVYRMCRLSVISKGLD
jgi:hypothetical protein